MHLFMNEQSNTYNPSDFQVDIRSFTRPRPLGVSGLMRVKDEAEWVEASIDTCIDALDELVICYQACTDDTPAILARKQRQYPEKIKLYFYAPPVYAHHLSDKEFDDACGLPDDSIHLLSNYYNYTLSKATYRYALKIDADQIHFTDRLKQLCDTYRKDVVRQPTLMEKGAYFYYRVYNGLMVHYPRIFTAIVRFLPAGNWIMKHYEGYYQSQVSQGGVSVCLSGINLSAHGGKWGVPAFKEGFSSLYFNGIGDLCLFPVSEHSYYRPHFETSEVDRVGGKVGLNSFFKQHRIIERFVLDRPVRYLYGGFMWYHMKFAYADMDQGHVISQDMELEKFQQMGPAALLKHSPLGTHKLHAWLFFYDQDREWPAAPSMERMDWSG